MRLIDLRPTRGPIEVRDDDRLIAYAVPANAGDHWAVYRLLVEEGQLFWTLPKIVGDSDLALVDLQGFLAWAVTS